MSSAAVQVVQGFSKTNRWILYTSMMLAPAQFISGIGNNCPSNIGFLAYNWYSQIIWYKAIRSKQIHALSLVPIHLNTTFALSYLGGVSSGTLWQGLPLGLGTAGVMILNCVSAWISWSTCQQEGFGHWEFFFFGWRTLTSGWHKFMLVWQIGDSMFALFSVISAIVIPCVVVAKTKDKENPMPWWARWPAIPIGALVMLLFGFPLILWMELIVQRNHIESETDWVAVWVFVGQVATMAAPSCTWVLGCFRRTKSQATSVV